MKPLVAVIGRPNVGKSTIVNRFLGQQAAIVQEKPGITRDRKQVDIEWTGHTFSLVDTGGWLATSDDLAGKVSGQAEVATSQAELILFVVDVITGITEEDELAAHWVRRSGKPVMLIANKADTDIRETEIWEFSKLGLGDPHPLSAIQGRNAGDVLDEIVSLLNFEDAVDEDERKSVRDEPRVAIVGRPNVGKSTLFNRVVGQERSIVHDMPGTTRDIIDTVIETEDGPVRFVDTAGMRRKAKIDDSTEYFSLVRALQAIDTVDAVVLVIDAQDGVTNQDQRLAERIDVSGKPVIIALNKWELLDAEQRAQLTVDVADTLGFISYAPVLKISALTGKSTHKLLPAIWEAVDAYTRRVPTAEVTKVIRAAQQAHQPSGGKIFYAMQGAIEPPTFILFTSGRLQPHYLRYLDRKLREHFNLGPSPLKIRVRQKGQ